MFGAKESRNEVTEEESDRICGGAENIPDLE